MFEPRELLVRVFHTTAIRYAAGSSMTSLFFFSSSSGCAAATGSASITRRCAITFCFLLSLSLQFLWTTILHSPIPLPTTRNNATVVEQRVTTSISTTKRHEDDVGGGSSAAAAAQGQTTPRRLFEPGSLLNQTRSHVLAQCDTRSVQEHGRATTLIPGWEHCLYSNKYNLMLTNSAKTGSVTQAFVFEKFFEQSNTYDCPKFRELVETSALPSSVFTVTTVREPTDRFFSGYRQMMNDKRVFEYPRLVRTYVPSQYAGFLNYLTKEWRGNRKRIRYSDSAPDLRTKAQMFNTFVRDYDNQKVMDYHLGLQSPWHMQWNGTHHTMPEYDMIMETATLTEDLRALAKMVGAPPPQKQETKKHQRKEPFDKSLIPDDVLQKICRLTAIDYCCLNYELPAVCQSAPEGMRVMCEWVPRSGEGNSDDAPPSWAIAPTLV